MSAERAKVERKGKGNGLTEPAGRRGPGRPVSALAAALIVVGAAGLLAGCELPFGSGTPTEITELPRSLSPGEQQVLSASNEFGFGLLSEVSQAAPDSNVFLSPLSAHMALGMALNGADGETFEAMRTTLAFGEADRTEISESYASLLELLRGLDPRVELLVGNSMWYERGFPFLASFKEDMREHFGARVEGLDFSDPAAVETINAWVDEATKGRIEKILDRIRPEEIAFLVNAVYFQGDWTEQFDAGETREAEFTLKDGSAAPVPLMHRKGDYAYARREDYQAVELPYGGKAFAMTVVLPDEEVGIDAFAAELDAAKWEEITGALGEPSEVSLFLPKFELEWGRELKDVLEAMGMGVAFDAQAADFGNMVDLERIRPDNVYLTRVTQKSFVAVDEEGTEAAAATSVGVGATSAPPTVRVDRPFLFAIRERLSGTVLFLGKIVRPPEGG